VRALEVRMDGKVWDEVESEIEKGCLLSSHSI
jgi:hypothetical protein